VTPLVDVCLVLLIIFMVVTPYLVPGKAVQLPQAHNPVTEPNSGVLRVSVEAGGKVFFGDSPVESTDVGGAVADALAKTPGRPVQVQADRRCAFGDVKGVLRALQENGTCREAALLVQHVDAQGIPASRGNQK
jgi:biopolymer transport protein ExbD